MPAIDETSFEATLAMTSFTAPRVSCAIGVHPHSASEVTAATYDKIGALMNHEHVVAVGEIGLDYHYDFSPREVQQTVFREQVRIAKRAHKPVIVHNRTSDEDLLRILGEEQDGTLRGVLHCFSSTTAILHRALALGLHVSFTGNITFKSSTLGDVVRESPLERIMLETDSPWMTPPPNRGKRNSPEGVRSVAEKIAEIKGLDVARVIAQTTANAKTFFGLALVLLCMLVGTSALAQTAPLPPQGQVQPPDSVFAPKKDTVALPTYYRKLGVGGGIGSSTLQPPGSQTGEANLFTTVVQANYMLNRIFGVDFRYWHFVNAKAGYRTRIELDTIPEHRGKDLNDYYSSFDLGLRINFNPRNPVMIGGAFGATYMLFSYPLENLSYSMMGFYGALNVAFNLQFTWGMLQPFGEYRIVQETAGDKARQHGQDLIPVLTFGVMYYFPEGFHY